MSKQQRQIPNYIMDFITEICPEAPHLYIASFNENTAITDATKLIRELRNEVKKLKKELFGTSLTEEEYGGQMRGEIQRHGGG